MSDQSALDELGHEELKTACMWLREQGCFALRVPVDSFSNDRLHNYLTNGFVALACSRRDGGGFYYLIAKDYQTWHTDIT